MSEESRVTEIGLSARTNIISVVRLVASSTSSPTGLIWMLETAGKHLDYKHKTAKQKFTYDSAKILEKIGKENKVQF